jgi:hypothetical protein
MPTWFLTQVPKICDGEKTASSQNIAGKMAICLQKAIILM